MRELLEELRVVDRTRRAIGDLAQEPIGVAAIRAEARLVDFPRQRAAERTHERAFALGKIARLLEPEREAARPFSSELDGGPREGAHAVRGSTRKARGHGARSGEPRRLAAVDRFCREKARRQAAKGDVEALAPRVDDARRSGDGADGGHSLAEHEASRFRSREIGAGVARELGERRQQLFGSRAIRFPRRLIVRVRCGQTPAVLLQHGRLATESTRRCEKRNLITSHRSDHALPYRSRQLAEPAHHGCLRELLGSGVDRLRVRPASHGRDRRRGSLLARAAALSHLA